MSSMLFVLLALLVSFAITAVICPFAIPFLRKVKFGQTILEEGPKWHQSKKGTPTMGGLVFIFAYVASALLFSMNTIKLGNFSVLGIVVGSLLFGLIGFADDFIKVVKKQNQGLTVSQKFVLQFLFAAAFVIFMASMGYTSTSIRLPFTEYMLDLGLFYYPITIVVIVFITNSFNLADGVDGLLASESIPALAVLALIALSLGSDDTAIMICGLIGGLFGFLIFNINPAKVFMGDTGSLFIGAVFAMSGVALNLTLLLFVAGIMIVFESVSVMLQVFYYKVTHGKRLFKMSPIHHHFEMCNWSENKIVMVFTTVTFVASFISFIIFKV